MQGLIKTLFGDLRTVLVMIFCVCLAGACVFSAARPLAGVAFPLALLASALYLARR